MLFGILVTLIIVPFIMFIILEEEKNNTEPSKTPDLSNQFISEFEDKIQFLQEIKIPLLDRQGARNLIAEIQDLKKKTIIDRRLIHLHIRENQSIHKKKKNNLSPNIRGAGTIGIINNSLRAVDLNRLKDFQRMEIEPLKAAKNKADELIVETDVILFNLARFLNPNSKRAVPTMQLRRLEKPN